MRPEREPGAFFNFSCPDNDVALSPLESNSWRSSASCCVTPAQSPGHSCGGNSLPNIIITRAQRHSERPQGFLISLQAFLKPAVLGACPLRRGSWGWAWGGVLPYSPASPQEPGGLRLCSARKSSSQSQVTSLFRAPPPWASTPAQPTGC